MIGNKIFFLLYVKNAVLMVVMIMLVLALFDTALVELQELAAQYVALSENLRILGVLGLGVIPAILTKVEADLISSLFPADNLEVISAKTSEK